jgi:DNA-directed RNA polymerase specialized sigma24 family protein
MTAHDKLYELLQRAIVDRDEEAWALVHGQLRRRLIAWAGHSSARSAYGLDCTTIADQAFARAWSALTPERFANFPTLEYLLSYLRTCVRTTIIDCIRQQTACGDDLSETHADTGGGPEEIILAKIERAILWDIIHSAVAMQSERVVLIESYVYNLPPRSIYARHPQLFTSIGEVYAAKRNLIERLGRNHELRSLYAERIQA